MTINESPVETAARMRSRKEGGEGSAEAAFRVTAVSVDWLTQSTCRNIGASSEGSCGNSFEGSGLGTGVDPKASEIG